MVEFFSVSHALFDMAHTATVDIKFPGTFMYRDMTCAGTVGKTLCLLWVEFGKHGIGADSQLYGYYTHRSGFDVLQPPVAAHE